jgi:RNA polymerase primary sigma factor
VLPDLVEELLQRVGRVARQLARRDLRSEQAVRAVVEELPEVERNVIRLRYGLNGDREPLSLSDAARRLDLRPTEVRALERRALEDLATRRELAALAA